MTTMAYATSVTVSDVDTHICGACKTQFAAIEDFLSHKRNGCFSFLTALPASLLSEYLSSVVVIPSSDLINSDTLSNQFDLNQQQICHAGAELAGYQMSSMPSDHSLLELQQNALQQVADVTSLTKYDQCSLDEISNINLSCQFGFETLSSESVVQLSQLMVEPSGAEPVSDGNIIISSVLSQRDNNVVVSQCESGDPDSLLMPYAAADVTESLFDEHAEVLKSTVDVIPSMSFAISSTDEQPNVMSSNIIMAQSADTAVSGNVQDMNIQTGETSRRRLPPQRYYCSVEGCKFSSVYKKDLCRHSRIHTGEKPFTCSICWKTFTRLDKLKLHARCHTGLKPYKCSHCSYTTSDGSSLKKHIRIHTNEKPFKCQVCSYAGRNADQLVVHLRTHTGDSPFACNVCEASFKSSSDLKRHIRLHTGEKPYACSFCDYRCSVKGNLHSHYRINHSQDNTMTCEICAYQTPSRRAYKNHALTHQATNQNVHVCATCSHSCKSASDLRIHRRTHDADRKTARQQAATVGSRTSTADASSRKTRNEIGISRKQFACHLCNASFVRLDSLRSHIRCHQRADVAMTQSAEESNGDSTNATPDDVVEHSDLNGCMFGLNDSEHCNTHLSKVVDDSLSIALDISYDALSG